MKRGDARRNHDLATFDNDTMKEWVSEFTAMATDANPDDPDMWWTLHAWGERLLHDLAMADGVRHGRVSVTVEGGVVVFEPRPIP
jgi:hypothetical protein